ncbi:MAG TPA: HK97-gp10 family putative phage morphogenesis protein [Tepidisphaeraceae bacterium]|nr:HK97-gp10 family putative phage morphogenesis protein [Tepidisphaeraceae bacterium]
MLGLSLRTKGAPAILRRLADIDKKVARKALREAINEATKPILKDAKAGVATDTKLLKKALGRKTKTFRGGLVATGIVGVRKQFKGKKGERQRTDKFRVKVGTDSQGRAVYMDPTNYAHLVEFGTRPHTIGAGDRLRRKGRSSKQIQRGFRHPGARPQPFIRPARDKNKSGTKAIVGRVLGNALKAQRAK